MIGEWLVRFYDKPRNRFLCVLGAFIVAPALTKLKLELRTDEKRLSDKTILLGRLELTGKLLNRWWER